MAGYGRQSSYTDGDVIQSDDTNNEFNQLDAAFDEDTGHAHDGTADNGAFIPLIKDKATLTSVTANGSEVKFDINGEGTLFTFSKGSGGQALFNGVELGNFAPLVHTHVIADVTGLQNSLDSKYSDSNQPHWDDIQGKPDVALNGGVIQIGNVDGLQTALDSKYSDTNKPQWSDIVNTPNFALVGHTHEMSEVTGLVGVLSSKYSDSNKPSWNNVTGKPDVALVGHTHVIDDVTGLQSALDSKFSATNKPQWTDVEGAPDFTVSGHTHVIADITGLQSALDSKFSSTNKPQWTDILSTPDFALNGHNHVIADITGLQSTLDTKYSPSNQPSWSDVTGKPDFDATYLKIQDYRTKSNIRIAGSSAASVPIADLSQVTAIQYTGVLTVPTGFPDGAVIELDVIRSAGNFTLESTTRMYVGADAANNQGILSHNVSQNMCIRMVYHESPDWWLVFVQPNG